MKKYNEGGIVLSVESEKNPNFIVDYLKNHGKKIDSTFIQKYLGTGATIEVFIYRSLQGRIYGKISNNFPELSENEEKIAIKVEERIKEILGPETYDELQKKMNAYNNGIEGQDVRNCDFSALSQDQFEMLRFDEDANFEGAKFKEGVNPEEILKRGNTQIQSQTNNGDMLHVAIIDTPIAESGDNQNLIVENFENIPTDNHGKSAYSIFSSINPNCVVHFYGVGSEDEDRAKAVETIIDYNNRCTDENKKIKLISCSHNLGESEKKLITEGKLNVISANNIHNGDFFEYFRAGDTDVVPQLTEEEGKTITDRYSNPAVAPIASKFVDRFKSFNDAVLVNVNLSIDQNFKKIKRHESDISISWGVPVIAAYYAMALSADPNMDYETFYDICQDSLKDGTKILDEKKFLEKIQNLEQEKVIDCQTTNHVIGKSEIKSFCKDRKNLEIMCSGKNYLQYERKDERDTKDGDR